MTDGYTWANSIWISNAPRSFSEAPPPALPNGFKWDEKPLTSKLKELQKNTKLRILKEYNYSDAWVAIFGRFETRLPPQIIGYPGGELRGYGFGHLGTAPAQLIYIAEGFYELNAK